VRLGWRHPWFWFYGLVIVIAFAPLRWLSLFENPRNVAVVMAVYVVALVGVNWRTRDWTLLLLPVYMLVTTLVLVPLSAWSYLRMATRHRNAGVIDPSRWVEATPSVAARAGWSTAASPDLLRVPSCMSIAALGACYSVPYHLGHDRLWVSARGSQVRIARWAYGKPVIVARHPRVPAGGWSILEAHLPAWHPDVQAPTLEEMLDLWGADAARPLPSRAALLEDAIAR